MSNSKTTVADRNQDVAAPPQAKQSATPADAAAALEQSIAKAQQGRVNVTPAKAIAMAGKLFADGKFAQVEKVCRQIIQARPANADAHNILGVTLNALGQSKEAIASLRRAIKLAPNMPSFHANLGEVLRQNGKLDEAKKVLEQSLKLSPDNAQALNNLGIVHYELEKFDDAVEYYRKALSHRPQMAEALNNLGNALRKTGDIDGAMQAYQEALTYRGVYPEAYNNLGTLLQQDKQFDEAEHALKKAISQNPRYIEAHNNLASLYIAQKKEVDALRILGDALRIDPTNVQTLLITARTQLNRSNYVAAEEAAKRALQKSPKDVEALTVLGQILHETDRCDAAVQVLETALGISPDNAEALNFYGVALKSVGRLDEAREKISKALSINDTMYGAYANLHDLVDFAVEQELFDRMQTIMESAENVETDQYVPLHFAFAKALEDRGEHKRALEHYIVGGRLKRAQLQYDEGEIFAFFDAIRAAFPKETFEDRKFAGLSDERPVFIVGMPRSGSTLVEQILASHPEVYGAGEVKYLSRALGQLRDRFPSLPRYPQMMAKITPPQMEMAAQTYLQSLVQGAGEAKRITDKLLTNYFFVGLVHLLFPKAKIVHTLRDPVDTCLSAFTKLFKDDMPHSYELGELGRYYGKYRELMAHWQAVLPKGVMHTVEYENVVANTEKEARQLVEFLGLEWTDKCLDFHKSDRPVKTASVAQVRKPIYNTAVQRSKKYGAGLRPLIDAIGGKPAGKATKAKQTA